MKLMTLVAIAVIAVALLISACQPKQATPPIQQEPQPTAECASDSGCKVGGCSGQVCTTSDKAAGLVTTCEYRAEYGCYKLTSCGCVAGKCSWKETPELDSCLEKAKSQPAQADQPQ